MSVITRFKARKGTKTIPTVPGLFSAPPVDPRISPCGHIRVCFGTCRNAATPAGHLRDCKQGCHVSC